MTATSVVKAALDLSALALALATDGQKTALAGAIVEAIKADDDAKEEINPTPEPEAPDPAMAEVSKEALRLALLPMEAQLAALDSQKPTSPSVDRRAELRAAWADLKAMVE